MKLAIIILSENKGSLRNLRDTQTQNANSYYKEANRAREQAAGLLRQAEAAERSASRACVYRNQLQAQLNTIDAAIAKLES